MGFSLTDLQLLRCQPGACALAAPSSGQVQSSVGLIGEGTELWPDFLKYMIPIVMKSATAHYPKQHIFVEKKREGKPRRRRRTCTREVEDPLTGLSHFHYGNDTEPADEPVDPASEQNHVGSSGQF